MSSSNFFTFQYAKQGTNSQMSPQGFSPAVTMASGIAPAAAGGVLDGPLVITDTRVYLVGANTGTNTTGLISVSLPNGVGNAAPSFLEGTTMPSGNWLAAWGDDTAFYFASSAQQWATCPASGCAGPPTVLADASSAFPYLVGDARAIYWINRTTDTAGRTTGFSMMKIAR